MKMFNIPNFLTASNMLCGSLAIVFAFAGKVEFSPYFIFVAAILDFFDGFVARLLNQQGELGKQLDSLADIISFGLAPGVIMFVLLVEVGFSQSIEDGVLQTWVTELVNVNSVSLVPLTAFVIPFFSLFRLAKFNIDTRQSESFIGLPTPANTLFFMTFPLLISPNSIETNESNELILLAMQPIIIIPIMVIMSLMLVAELPLFALKFKSFKWKGNEIRFVFLISCGILISILLIWSIPFIVLLYLLLSFIQNILRKSREHEI